MDGPGPLERGPELLARCLTWALICASVSLLAAFVVARQGNLAWDDADYLRRGLSDAREATNGPASLIIPRALDRLLEERPKPPLLVGWITLCALCLGRDNVGALVVLGSVAPFLVLLMAVAELSRRAGGPWAGLIGVVGVVASPRALSFGGRVMVETFLSLWVLLALTLASRLLSETGRGRKLGAGLGMVTGLALLTKATAVLLLGGGIVWCLWRIIGSGPDRNARLRVLALAVLVCVLIAAPWYVHNAPTAARFALFSARFNLVAEGQSHVKPVWDRLVLLLADLPGWPLAVLLGISGFLISGRVKAARKGNPDPSPSFLFLRRIFADCPQQVWSCATAVLLVPSYFDSRFLLPLWPSVSVALSGPAAGLMGSLGVVPRAFTNAALAASVSVSALGMVREHVAPTYWNAGNLIDQLVSRHGVSTLANVGNTETWNVCKTGLINELRTNPADCFVLHDLSAGSREELCTRLPKFDAVVVLEPEAFPAGFLSAAPGLNRAATVIHDIVATDPALVRLDDLPLEGLPPMRVYLRRRENRDTSFTPATQVSRIGPAAPSAVR